MTMSNGRVCVPGAGLVMRKVVFRVMALAALHAIGDFNTMANLSQRIRLERSPRVQRLAAAAVADYFDPSGDIVLRRRAVR